MNESHEIEQHIDQLIQAQRNAEELSLQLASLKTIEEKIHFLRSQKSVVSFFKKHPECEEHIQKNSKTEFAFLQFIGLGQAALLFPEKISSEIYKEILTVLLHIEEFYAPIGGVIGYHIHVLQLVRSQLGHEDTHEDLIYHAPPYFDIRNETDEVHTAIRTAIDAQEAFAEIYPVGGAGDRLNLQDEKTGRALPAALLSFCGRALLEDLFRDLQAREYLHYKLTGKQCSTPVILMTSLEKNNAHEIQEILKEKLYFGRPKSSMYSIVQPLVPVIGIDGIWGISQEGHLIVKPGGHGVIWRLASLSKAFDWLRDQKKNYLLLRQLNNPLASLDYTMLALAGFGIVHKKDFGFTSVPRKIGAQEGLNVLVQKGKEFGITNVEYTEFTKKKYAEKLLQSTNAAFANTNILFADLDAIEKASKKLPFPGMIVNMKQKQKMLRNGSIAELPCARLETTMQNIADALYADSKENVRAFIVLNAREKTISVTKRSFEKEHVEDTPESAFFDLVAANQKLLKRCAVQMPEMNSLQEYLHSGPAVLCLYHPALGPLYSVICQKIRKGRMAENAELQLEIAELDMENVDITGSLLIEAKCVDGTIDPKTHELRFGKDVGCCTLKNVLVSNLGIDRSKNNIYWKNEIQRKEACKITLIGDAVFIGEDVELRGDLDITVPAGMCCRATKSKEKKLILSFEPLRSSKDTERWNWKYEFTENNEIHIRPQKRSDVG